jgi:hypothetical protein
LTHLMAWLSPMTKWSSTRSTGIPYANMNDGLLDSAWYVSNVSIIFDAPCLFLHHLHIVSLHLVAFLYIFRN